MRYFIRLSYNGEGFHGWQRQPNAISVQQTLEEALSTVCRFPVTLTGAGRTDAGVHAREMYAHFDLPEKIADKGRLILSLDRLAGRGIAVDDIFEVSPDAHARFDAVERTYKYFVSYRKSPFLNPFCWTSPSLLDVGKMNEAASILLDTEDFTSFAKLHSDARTNICDVRRAVWEEVSGESNTLMPTLFDNGLVFTISADRFLRNMVRAIVGTLVDVGRGKLSVEGFRDIVSSRDRCVAGTSMPGNALFLWEVKYPYL